MKTLVLFSGGLDSTAALLWALNQGGDVHALSIYYGQPAGQKELNASRDIAMALGLYKEGRFHRLDISGVYYGMSDGLFRPKADQRVDGLNTAFVPMRNPTLLSCAAARALNIWPTETDIRLVVGFNRDDAHGFPDCKVEFIAAFDHTMVMALGSRRVTVEAPWLHRSKAGVVAWVTKERPADVPLLQQSWSCYRDWHQHCGECTACVTRARAFAPPASVGS